MTAADLLKRCREAGLTLQREGDGLAVWQYCRQSAVYIFGGYPADNLDRESENMQRASPRPGR